MGPSEDDICTRDYDNSNNNITAVKLWEPQINLYMYVYMFMYVILYYTFRIDFGIHRLVTVSPADGCYGSWLRGVPFGNEKYKSGKAYSPGEGSKYQIVEKQTPRNTVLSQVMSVVRVVYGGFVRKSFPRVMPPPVLVVQYIDRPWDV